MLKVVILAGGMGTRLAEETVIRPKPMVEIGEKPILWHLMNIYSSYGFNDFIIALGFKSEVIKEYFLKFHALNGNLTVDIANGKVNVHSSGKLNWHVDLIETGRETQTGGRVKRLQSLIGNETFMVTYADGLAQIDINALMAFHRSHGKIATITAVPPPSRFGKLDFDGDMILNFSEKPLQNEGWINGGFFVFEPEVFDYIKGDETVLEREPMEKLAKDRELMAFKHTGFWQMMDTLQEKQLLEKLWKAGNALWEVKS
jgi:glucose-1-phosphate cytidylyltransferase